LGAGAASLISAAMLLGAALLFLRKTVPIKSLIRVACAPLLAAIVMGLYLRHFQDANILLLLISGAAIYLMMLFLGKSFSVEEFHLIKGVVGIKDPAQQKLI